MADLRQLRGRFFFLLVMYQSVCKFWWGEREWRENGFHIWTREDDREVVKGKA